MLYFLDQCEARLPFHQGHQGVSTLLADHDVSFPVSQSFALVDYGWSLLNTHLVRYAPTPFIASQPFAILFLAPQVLMKSASRSLVRIDILIYPLMTYAGFFVCLHPQHDLFRAPILPDLVLHPRPRLPFDSPPFPFTTLHCFALGLLWAIPSLSSVSLQFSTDRRFMYPYCFGYLCLVLSAFQKRIYLVSFFLGKLFVVTHECSFYLIVGEVL